MDAASRTTRSLTQAAQWALWLLYYMHFVNIFMSHQFTIPTFSWSSSFVIHTIMSSVGKVKLKHTHTTFTLQHLIYFWTIAKPSHRDYFELHRMQINIYRTIAELRTLTTDTKLFTTLWIVQNHTNTALLTEILALRPFWGQWMCVLPPGGEGRGLIIDSTVYGMLTKTFEGQYVWDLNRM